MAPLKTRKANLYWAVRQTLTPSRLMSVWGFWFIKKIEPIR